MYKKTNIDESGRLYLASIFIALLCICISVAYAGFFSASINADDRLLLIILHSTKFFSLLMASRIAMIFLRRSWRLIKKRQQVKKRTEQSHQKKDVKTTRVESKVRFISMLFLLVLLCCAIYIFYSLELHDSAEVSILLQEHSFIDIKGDETLLSTNVFLQLAATWIVLSLGIYLDYQTHRV